MNDLQLTQIIQRIEGEDFAWWLHILVDGRVQALWREAISGAVNCTRPLTLDEVVDELGSDLDGVGLYAFSMRRERLTTLGGVEYQLELLRGSCVVRWLDADSGRVRKAWVYSAWSSPTHIPDKDILRAVHTPIFWMD